LAILQFVPKIEGKVALFFALTGAYCSTYYLFYGSGPSFGYLKIAQSGLQPL
jgi:hypothetical protein